MLPSSYRVIIGFIALQAVRCFAQPATAPAHPKSATFQDILNRVAQRDKETDAILSVKPKADAPQGHTTLIFAMGQETPSDPVHILIYVAVMAGNGVYESYQLQPDDAMRDELAKQALLKAANERKQRELADRQTKRIHDLTNGSLHYGMTQAEVIATIGAPAKVVSHQMVGWEILEYANMDLEFKPNLIDITPH